MRANALKQMDRAAAQLQALALRRRDLRRTLHPRASCYFVDFKNPLHLLIVCCTGVDLHAACILGLVALGAHVNRYTLRVLARLDDVSADAEACRRSWLRFRS